MDKRLKSLKCVNCDDILDSPVSLPCSHIICQIHISTLKHHEHVICSACRVSHAIKEVATAMNQSSAMSSLILKSGAEQEEPKWFGDLDYYIYDRIDELKNKAELKRELLKLALDQIAHELVDKLGEFEKRHRCENSNSRIRPGDDSRLNDEFKKLGELERTSWQKWSSVVWGGQHPVVQAQKVEFKRELDELEANLKRLEHELFDGEIESKKVSVDLLERKCVDRYLVENKDFLKNQMVELNFKKL